jgi:hypothetical protein
MMAANQAGGTTLGGPDACKTPPAQAPLPYPNTAPLPMASKFCPKVLLGGAPAHNLGTEVVMSIGDNAGVTGGVVSNKVMNKMNYVVGATTVLICSKPAVRMTSPTKHNDGNCVGVTIVVAQFKVIIPAP